MSLITDIAEAIKVGAANIELDLIIQEFLSGPYYFGEPITIVQWRLDNYAKLRQWAYPPMAEYLDAQVKINSGDSDIIAEGQAQLTQYLADCLSVKLRFPKE